MPQLFRSIALSKGQPLSVAMYAPGGTGFVNHVADPNVYSLFRQNWDVVVLQPGTGESAGASWPVDSTIRRGHQLLDSVYTYNPCAKVFLYEIPYGVPSANDYPTYFAVQSQIRDSVTKLSDALHVPFVPAGECTRAYYAMHPNLLLHGSFNDVHPNANGSFLVATAMYAGIFRQTTSGSAFTASVQPDTATVFFTLADSVVLQRLDEWRLNAYNLSADFQFVQNADQVQFQDHSVNATSLLWNFGDGTQSTDSNPSHVFASAGLFTVTQYVYRGDCTDSISKTISVQDAGISAQNETECWRIVTNPTTGTKALHILQTGSVQTIELIDLTGKSRFSQPMNASVVELPQISSGITVLRIFGQSGRQWSVRLF